MNSQADKRAEFLNLVIMYLEYRNSFSFKYQPYFFWRNIISYIINTHDPKFIRYLFNKLIKKSYIKILRSKRKYTLTYIWNPLNKKIKKNSIIVYFD